ncbi:MAG TPA: DUF4159 domain-containing protein [Rhizomicrobium sp.]|nr:DUF4159 domain-containing protein [Rhizomicrobium sp.]
MGWLGNISFGAPLVLAALVVLPVIFWLLRVTPPTPRRVVFPPLRLLLGLSATEETPARTPLWLLLFRLLIAALMIVALAEPMFGEPKAVPSSNPLVLFVDNDWMAAHEWKARDDAMTEALRGAARDGRPVAIVATADAAQNISLLNAGQAERLARSMVPEAWTPDRLAAADALAKTRFAAKPDILWLSDGADHGHAEAVAARLSKIGNLTVVADGPGKGAIALLPASNGPEGFTVKAERLSSLGDRSVEIEALGQHGEVLSTAHMNFVRGKTDASVKLPLPLEMRNRTARIAIANENAAGGVQLLDSSNRRRSVGLVSASSLETQQPLLSDVFYLQRALSPYADLTKGSIDKVLSRGVSVLVLADIGKIVQPEYGKVSKFVEDGGVLIRFAGARMTDGADDLVPARLRGGGRYLDGALAWAEPQRLAGFPDASPFNGLSIPKDVTISRQILAEPSVELGPHTWARLADGTPLVTAAQRGKGWIVLFHVTASPAWSSLPLSGLYVDMLRRILDLSNGSRPAAIGANVSLAPMQVMDGFGRLQKAPAEALPLRGNQIGKVKPSASHPPGYYGSEGAEVALNTVGGDFTFDALDLPGQHVEYYAASNAISLGAPLLAIAFALLLIDALVSLALRGLLTVPRGSLARAAPMLLFFVLLIPQARADDAFDMKSALDTRLAYVKTGLSDLDNMSHAGLVGLDVALTQRTSYEPQDPMGVDLEKDDLSFFPLLYWPMDPREKDPSPAVIQKLTDYMKNGGTILFDTRDLSLGAVRGPQSPGEQTLRRIAAKLDLPPLEPIPPDHVLTKAFYLLQSFPGRWDGGKVWVEKLPPADPDAGPSPARGGDGVSPVIIGGNDWAAAWAIDNQGRPLVAVVPGGERQREMAYRFGVNVVMYAFTGNYKTDQVHVPALLERLGQ